MTYHVEITPEAGRQFYEAADRLALFPEAYTFAPEHEAVPFDVRQKLYGNYRILFTIAGDRVIVLRVRHAARLSLHSEDIHDPADR